MGAWKSLGLGTHRVFRENKIWASDDSWAQAFSNFDPSNTFPKLMSVRETNSSTNIFMIELNLLSRFVSLVLLFYSSNIQPIPCMFYASNVSYLWSKQYVSKTNAARWCPDLYPFRITTTFHRVAPPNLLNNFFSFSPHYCAPVRPLSPWLI